MFKHPFHQSIHATLLVSAFLTPINVMAKITEVACVGDSTTFGMNIEQRTQFSYPAQLQSQLGNTYSVINYGANGATAIHNTPDYTPYITRDVYQQSINSKPDIVIITLGANDSKTAYWNQQKYTNDLRNLVVEYLELTPTIFLGLPIPAFNQPKHWDVNETNLINARKSIRQLANEFQLPIIDFYSPMNSTEYFQEDGVHPNALGAKNMALTAKIALDKIAQK